ncbi:putative damage-inducible protein DinB [Croceifilum oryzae]|uniref:Damage-inducible protein DinB n=2 Tax=Croceifilum oryzae TaxID=1553429 RepID=A0AAJ1THB8_9BACL|nr:putative damage-inducible protein DinB [Croceifilum oryzae]
MMTQSNEAFVRALLKSLKGERGHIPIANALSDIGWELAGKHIEGIPYSIYQLLKHMIYWQDFLLLGLQGEQPKLPTHVKESWPDESNAENQEEWQKVIEHFLQGLEQACTITQTMKLDEPLEKYPDVTRAEHLRNIASHNSYHLGEIVVMRRLLGSWPPPSGGYPA